MQIHEINKQIELTKLQIENLRKEDVDGGASHKTGSTASMANLKDAVKRQEQLINLEQELKDLFMKKMEIAFENDIVHSE